MKLLTSPSMLFLFFVAFTISNVDCHRSKYKNIPALIVFGDSIVDPGNNNDIKTIIKCNFPPYGANYTNHEPTGRFCNGKIPGDLIASELGIKEYVPAYVGTELSPEDLITGVSFASGGIGFDPLTAKVAFTIVSAHRTPVRMYSFAFSAKERGIQTIIAGAGGAVHLPGMVASLTSLPVIGGAYKNCFS